MALGWFCRAVERLLRGLRRSGGESWRLACHLGAQDGSKIQKMSKKMWFQEACSATWVFYRFGVDFEGQLRAMLASKIDQKLSQTPPRRA